MTDEHMTSDMARIYRDEGDELRRQAAAERKAAETARADAEYLRGQAQWHEREAAAKLASVAKREEKLAALGEKALLAREQAANDKLVEAQKLLSQYSNDRHAAARALVEINEREKRGKAA
jgi:hypothetical protein